MSVPSGVPGGVPANRLDRAFFKHQTEYERAALRVLRSGRYVLGEEVRAFENAFAAFIGAKYCVGLASGLDALEIAFRLLGVGTGDEVITQANAYIACVMGITKAGAAPVFVEPDEYYGIDASKIEAAVTPKTKAVLAVHLYGHPCDMESVLSVAKRHGLFVVEDVAQAHGARQNGKPAGNFGDIGCFSFYPSKNLGAFGDAGAVTLNSPELDDAFRVFRNYGSEKRYYNKVVGANSRLDEIQAALLSVRLAHLDGLNRERAALCANYAAGIKNPALRLPRVRPGCVAAWHQFAVRVKTRGAFTCHLEKRGIQTLIHYPVPPHLSEAYAYLGRKRGDFPITEACAEEIVSLPLYNGMTAEEQNYVIETINGYDG